jgi:hypothetical protein
MSKGDVVAVVTCAASGVGAALRLPVCGTGPTLSPSIAGGPKAKPVPGSPMGGRGRGW